MTSEIQSVLITGTSRGLGHALALDLSSTYRVIGVARGDIVSSESDSRRAKVEHYSGVDLSNLQHLDSLAPLLANCDALINNAAIAHDGILATQGLQSIQAVLQVNILSVVYLTKLYVRERLASRQPGNVVTIGSIAAISGYKGLSIYGASKGALISFTKAMAREMGSKGFRFNVVLPGFIETDMSSDLAPEQRRQIVKRTPAGRLGTVDDIVPAVRFLLSEDSRFMTGQSLIIDGGLTA